VVGMIKKLLKKRFARNPFKKRLDRKNPATTW